MKAFAFILTLLAVAGQCDRHKHGEPPAQPDSQEERIPITQKQQKPDLSNIHQPEEEQMIPITPPDSMQASATPTEKQVEPEVFMIVQDMPVFPGGEQAMFAFIDSALVYPENLRQAGVAGLVYVRFIVQASGEIDPDGIQVLRGVHADLDTEAIQVIRKMPTWEPGRQRGQPVATYMTYPIRFDP